VLRLVSLAICNGYYCTGDSETCQVEKP